LPIDPSSLTRRRKRIGEEGVNVLLAVTIEAAQAAGLIKRSSVDRVIVDTTVMPEAIAHPTDSRLLEKSREHLVKLADEQGLTLRQNYNRQGLACQAAATRLDFVSLSSCAQHAQARHDERNPFVSLDLRLGITIAVKQREINAALVADSAPR
jgi:hypothetical protein